MMLEDVLINKVTKCGKNIFMCNIKIAYRKRNNIFYNLPLNASHHNIYMVIQFQSLKKKKSSILLIPS